jgi:hypothetical protein
MEKRLTPEEFITFLANMTAEERRSFIQRFNNLDSEQVAKAMESMPTNALELAVRFELAGHKEERLPQTLGELCDFIETHADEIYVRDRGPDGAFNALALTELTPPRLIHHVLEFIRRGRIPVYVKKEKT